jgi:2-polyprenyl-6-methoxyphenol hydroxylase-like FAD-dependent oxidoreductase
MKISIVGGGPAGLYFASAVKKLNPSFNVTVYEAKNESIAAYGLGYTFQVLGSYLLERLDPNFFKGLFGSEPRQKIKAAILKTNDESQTHSFTDGFSVTRHEMMRYLIKLAENSGVRVKEKKVTPSFLKRLQQSSDLLVGADGVNSLVRKAYADEFGAATQKTELRYSWFTNDSPEPIKEACFYAFKAEEGVILLTSYPLAEKQQVVIIEMTQDCLQSGQLRGKTPEQAIPYLNEVLGSNGGEIALQASGLPWYEFKMNTSTRLFHNNVVLMGDAAFALHFGAGQGLTTAFTMGHTLASCLQRTKNLKQALTHYSQSTQMLMHKPARQSEAQVQWLEQMDKHCAEHSGVDLLTLFGKKMAH